MIIYIPPRGEREQTQTYACNLQFTYITHTGMHCKLLHVQQCTYLPLSRRVFPFIWTLVLDEAESVGLIINNKGCKHVSEGDKEASTSNQCLVVLQFQYASRRQQKLNYVRNNLSRLMQND